MTSNNQQISLIIPAAGLGTRMRSVNQDLPKEMLPVGDKPAIQYAVEEGISAGIENIIIIINRQKEIIRRYFEEREFAADIYPHAQEDYERIQNRCSISFLYQEKPLGESDAVGLAEDIAYGSSVAVIYPDNIYSPAPGVLKALKKAYSDYKADVLALIEVTDENISAMSFSGAVNLGHIEDDIYRIEEFIQKKSGPFVKRFRREKRACGISISGPHLFDYIKRMKETVGEGEFTDYPVRSLIIKERGTLGLFVPGTVFDIGNPAGYALCMKTIKTDNLIK